MAPSSSGLGHGPFKAATRVRVPLGSPVKRPANAGLFTGRAGERGKQKAETAPGASLPTANPPRNTYVASLGVPAERFYPADPGFRGFLSPFGPEGRTIRSRERARAGRRKSQTVSRGKRQGGFGNGEMPVAAPDRRGEPGPVGRPTGEPVHQDPTRRGRRERDVTVLLRRWGSGRP